MPARSNDFQRLVKFVQQHQSAGATVTESKGLADRQTGCLREVDIVVEGSFHGHRTTLCIECRDRARVDDVRWVDEMIGKHGRLPTDVLILVSHSGFTPEAERVAAGSPNIRLMKFDDIDGSTPERLFPHTAALWAKTGTWTPLRVTAEVKQFNGVKPELVTLFPDTEIVDESGETVGVALSIIGAFLHQGMVQTELLKAALPEHKGFILKWPSPTNSSESQLCLKKLSPAMICPITWIEVVGECRVDMDDVPLKHGLLGDTKIAWGDVMLGGKRGIVVSSGHDSIDCKTTVEFDGSAS